MKKEQADKTISKEQIDNMVLTEEEEAILRDFEDGKFQSLEKDSFEKYIEAARGKTNKT